MRERKLVVSETNLKLFEISLDEMWNESFAFNNKHNKKIS